MRVVQPLASSNGMGQRPVLLRLFADPGGRDVLQLACRDAELGEATGEVGVDLEVGDEPTPPVDASVRVGGEYLLEALEGLDSERVRVGLTNHTSPVVFSPDGAGEVAAVHMIMPMFDQEGAS